MTKSDTAPLSAIDGASFRKAMARFLTGVTIITVANRQQRLYGLTVNSFNSVSLSPPLVLWSLDKRNAGIELFRNADGFAVNIMAAAQIDLCQRFSADGDRFADIEWEFGAFGQPLLRHVLASMECRHWAEYDGGDHVIMVGEVITIANGDGRPLAFFGGKYGRFDPDA